MISRKLVPVFLIVSLLSLVTCEKDKRQMLVQTGTVTNILTTTAYASGDILDLGEGVSQHGHCWSSSPNVSVSDSKSELGVPPGAGGFTSELTGLQAGTTYFIKAYCSRGGETVYGSEINFTTASADLPVLTTVEITGVTKTGAVSGGNITNQGGTAVTARGVCWSTASNPTTDNSKTSNGSGTGTFASNISSLAAGTTYFIRAYATNAGGTAYGNELSFTSDSDTPVPPTVTTASITSVTTSSASCGGEVTNEGSESVTARGVCWSTSENPTVSSNTTSDGNGSGTFVSSIAGLDPGTTYYVRAYATSGAGTSYGNESDFTTDAVLAELTTLDINTITTNSAKSGGNITSDGGAEITARGVCWSTSNEPTLSDNHSNDGLGAGTFISTMIGLTGNTTYYVRAFATNSIGTAYGNELDFSTGNLVPSVTTSAITSVTSNSASCGGNISDDGGSAVTARGVCWSITSNPDISDDKTSDGTGTGSFTSNLTDLSAGTTYYARAYATNGAGTSYGDELIFSTECISPFVSAQAASDIAPDEALLNGVVNPHGFETIVIFQYGQTTSYGESILASQSPVSGLDNTPVSTMISSLEPNTIYHFRIRVESCGGILYSDDMVFETPCPKATVTTLAAGSISTSAALLNAVVNANNFSADVVFEYGLTTAYGSSKTADQNPVTGNSNTAVSTGISGLTPNTTYHFRIRAENCGGISYGQDLSFTTECEPAYTVTDDATEVLDVSAVFNAVINPHNSSTTVSFEYGTTTSYGSTIFAVNSPLIGSVVQSTHANVTGLTQSTQYHYRVKTVNCGGTVYGSDKTFSTPFCPPELAVTHTAGSVAPVSKTVTYGVVETDLSGETKCWITRNLGATYQANSAISTLESTAGWYWQFNKKQGYKHDGATRTPSSAWVSTIPSSSDWLSANDPCSLLLGSSWRIPTGTEWENVDVNGGWVNYSQAFASVLKLHAAGVLQASTGALYRRGELGYYFSSTQQDTYSSKSLQMSSSSSYLNSLQNGFGTPLRCIKD